LKEDEITEVCYDILMAFQ